MINPTSTGDIKSEAHNIKNLIDKSQNSGQLNLARRRTHQLMRSGSAKHLDSSIRKTTKVEWKSLQKHISRKSKKIKG